MTDQIAQKFIDLLGPIKDDRLHFATYENTAVAGGHNVVEMSKVQRELAEQILKQHLGFDEVKWMQEPGGPYGKGGKSVIALTRKLADDIDSRTYIGRTAYVYQIMFTPKIYDPKTIHNTVKDGCAITPLFYNPETFTPYKKIILEYSPEYTEQIFTAGDMKQYLRDQLEKVLQNPDEYVQEGLRGVMVRMAIV